MNNASTGIHLHSPEFDQVVLVDTEKGNRPGGRTLVNRIHENLPQSELDGYKFPSDYSMQTSDGGVD